MLLCLLGGIAPALAAPPAEGESFNPDTLPPNPGDSFPELSVASDQEDGGETGYHLTFVATTDTTHVDWYICPSSYAGSDPTDPASTCTLWETDDTPATVSAPGGGAAAGADLGFDAAADVPDDEIHDVVAWFCSAAPYTSANCKQEKEDDIQFDDAGSGSPTGQSSAGEILEPVHASNVSDRGFLVSARTSSDVTSTAFCLVPGDAAVDPSADCTDAGSLLAIDEEPDASTTTSKSWSADVVPPDTGEFALVLFDYTGGAGFCAGSLKTCQLDSHYVVVSASEPATVTIAFPEANMETASSDACGNDPDQPQGSTGEPGPFGPNPDAVDESQVRLDWEQHVQGCVFDQSGNLLTNDVEWAFQATPDTTREASAGDPAGFGVPYVDNPAPTPARDGEPGDSNGNAFFEQVDGTVASAGPDAVADTTFEADSPGDFTLTFCVDADDSAAATPKSPSPCVGEALSAVAVTHVLPKVDHVHVREKSASGPLCHTGGASIEAVAGSTIDLTGCVLARDPDSGAEVSGGEAQVLWILNPDGKANAPGTLTSAETTTRSSGKAQATVSSRSSAAGKSTTVRFCVDEVPASATGIDGNGVCDATESAGTQALQSDFRIDWLASGGSAGACPNGFQVVRGTRKNNLLIGSADCDRLLGRAGDDTLRGKAADDTLRGGRGRDRGNGGPGSDRCVGVERKARCER